jgi:hypothetical protein
MIRYEVVKVAASPAWNSPAKIKAAFDAGIVVVVLRRVVVVVKPALEHPLARIAPANSNTTGLRCLFWCAIRAVAVTRSPREA